MQDEQSRALLTQSLSESQVNFLLQKTPKNEIKTKPGRGGKQQSYVEHGYVTEQLNNVFGFNWDLEVLNYQVLDDECIVQARLTVRTPNGTTIIKEQFGGMDIERFGPEHRTKPGKPLSIADTLKGAESDALKKCASLLGIGLDLYGRDYDDYDPVPQREERVQRPPQQQRQVVQGEVVRKGPAPAQQQPAPQPQPQPIKHEIAMPKPGAERPDWAAFIKAEIRRLHLTGEDRDGIFAALLNGKTDTTTFTTGDLMLVATTLNDLASYDAAMLWLDRRSHKKAINPLEVELENAPLPDGAPF